MGSRIIDVAIGLVLVFALTSLLVTTLVEALSTRYSMRGTFLKRAIESFLGDDESFTTALLKHPLLVSLAPGTKDNDDRKPSYIGADMIVTSLLSYLTQNYVGSVRPSSPAELIAAVKAGTPPAGVTPANEDFRNGLASLLHGVENDWPGYEKRLQAWYDSVAQRSTGWYKRWANIRVLIIGFLIAAVGNIDPIVIGPRLWNDASLREAVVAAGQEASKRYGERTSPSMSSTSVSNASSTPAPAPAGADTSASPRVGSLIQVPLPRRVAETEAVAGNYSLLERSLLDAFDAANATKRNPQDNMASRMQTLKILKDLPHQLNDTRMSDDDTVDFVNKLASSKVTVDSALAKLKSLIPDDTPTDTNFRLARTYRDQLEAAIAKERTALAKKKAIQRRQRDCSAIEDQDAKQLCMRMSDLTQLHDAGLPIGWSPPAWPDIVHFDSDAKCLEDAAQAGDKDATKCDHRWNLGNVGIAIIGWAITAVAAMLGAPFWFDLLGRLIKLRGAGTRIDPDPAKRGDGSDQKISTLNTSATPAPSAAAQREPMSDALNDQERSLSQSEIERIQRMLQEFGAAVTGTFDSVTRNAIKQWQQARKADVTGELTRSQIDELLGLSQGDDDHAG
jgi:hypothetical protein